MTMDSPNIPERIAPGVAPGGLVFCLYRCSDGVLVLEQRITEIDRIADQAEAAADLTKDIDGGTVIAVYDGDDGTQGFVVTVV